MVANLVLVFLIIMLIVFVVYILVACVYGIFETIRLHIRKNQVVTPVDLTYPNRDLLVAREVAIAEVVEQP